MALSTLKKSLLIAAGVVLLVVVLVIAFISPITKYLIEKYDEKYTGRRIELDWAYVNPFTGSIFFDDLKIYEYQSDSTFVSFDGLGVNVEIFKLLGKEYEISSVTLNEPWVKVVQNKKVFNFNDIIEKFSKPKDTVEVDTTPLHLNVNNIEINGGEFIYIQQEIPVRYAIKKFDFESTGLYWDRDTIFGKFSFESGIGSGKVKGDFTVRPATSEFRLATVIEKFDLQIIEQYLKDFSNYGRFRANLDADINCTGNFKDQENINLHGFLGINDFHFGKTENDDYTSFKKLAVNLIDISPKNKVYEIDSVMLSDFFFRYEKYDSLDNIQRIFGKKGSKVEQAKAEQPEKFNLILEIADYVKVLAKNFLHSYYKLNKLAIRSADIQYDDYSLREKFSLALDPLTIISDSIDKNDRRFAVTVKSGIKPYGDIDILLSMNPKTEGDFDLNYSFDKIPASMFNPYLTTYTSYPFDRGTIEINGKWNVRNEQIQSDNHFLFLDPRLTKRVKKKDAKWIPMPLIMAFLRERGNVIDYKVPITGNLKDPKFHLSDIIIDILKNIVIKPATTPYRFEVKNIEQEVEKALSVKWFMRQPKLLTNNDKFVEKIADFLKNTPEATITIDPVSFEDKEKENIMLFEAKKKYYRTIKHITSASLSEEDSTNVEKMSTKDNGFKAYLDAQIPDTMLFTVQKKSYKLIGDKQIQAKYKQLLQQRHEVFLQYFKDNGTDGRVQFKKADTGIPYNGFSFYRISYKGEIPQELREAYENLEELNEQNPRKEYKKERKKLFGII